MIHVLAWAIASLWIIPFMGVFMASIRPLSEILSGWWNFQNINITPDNYINAWTNEQVPISRHMINSILIAIPSTIIPIFTASLAAYCFARFSFPLKNMLFLTIVLLQTLPQQSVVIPLFIMLSQMGLLNTLPSLVIVHTAFAAPWTIFFFRNFFATLPVEVEEQARVDGASDFKIYYKIVLPMSLPALSSVAALQFVWVWNDFFFALIFLSGARELQPLTVAISLLRGRYFVDWGLLTAASVLTMAIPLLLYALLQRYLMRGIVVGAVKG